MYTLEIFHFQLWAPQHVSCTHYIDVLTYQCTKVLVYSKTGSLPDFQRQAGWGTCLHVRSSRQSMHLVSTYYVARTIRNISILRIFGVYRLALQWCIWCTQHHNQPPSCWNSHATQIYKPNDLKIHLVSTLFRFVCWLNSIYMLSSYQY